MYNRRPEGLAASMGPPDLELYSGCRMISLGRKHCYAALVAQRF